MSEAALPSPSSAATYTVSPFRLPWDKVPSHGSLKGDTVYVAALDGDGNAASLIFSLYGIFGACVTDPASGVVLQNRAAYFSLDPAHPNRLEPGKVPLHTLIASLAFRQDRLWAALGRIRLGDELRDRHLGEARVGQPAVAVVVGDLLRLHEKMHVIGAVIRAELERLDQVQHLQHRAALRRRRRLVEGDAVVRAAQRLVPARALGAQVSGGEKAAEPCQLGRNLAFVETGATVGCDRLQRPRQRGIGQAGLAGRKQRRRCRILREIGLGFFDPSGHALADGVAVARSLDRGFEAARERQLAEARMRFAEAGYGAGRGNGRRDEAAEWDFLDPLQRSGRGGPTAAVEAGHLARRGVIDQPEGVAAHAAHVRIDHAERRRGGDGRVHRRAPVAQRLRARLRGERVRARHHPSYLSFLRARRAPLTSASSFFRATSRSIGAMPQLVQG